MTEPAHLEPSERIQTLLVTFNYPPIIGGIETLMYHIIRNMPGRVIVLAPWAEGCEAFDRHQVFETLRIRCPQSTPWRCLFFAWHGSRFLLRHSVEHIQSATMFAGLVSMFLGKLCGIPYSVYAMGMEIAILNTRLRSRPYRWLFSLVLRNASRILSISDFTSSEVTRAGVPPDNIFKIPSGIDTTTLDGMDPDRFEDFRKRVHAQLDLRGRKVILTIARMVPRKGHDQVIHAMALLIREVSDAVYVIVGGGPERQRLEDLVRQLGLGDHVKFAGRVPDEEIVYYHHLADVFILASRHIVETADVEGFGQVFMESNYCGKPVVGGNSGGIPDAIVDGKSGFLVNPADPIDIAEKLRTLLLDPGLRERMGEYGRERVIERFSHKVTVEKILEGLGQKAMVH